MKKIIFVILCVTIIMNNSFSYEKLGYKWKAYSMPVQYYINPTGFPSGAVNAIQDAFSTWQIGSNGYFKASYAGTTSAGMIYIDGFNVISIGAMSSSSNIAETWATAYDGYCIDVDIVFDITRAWSTSPVCPIYYFDLQSVAVHEVGHFLGLADLYSPSDANKVMYYGIGYGEIKRTLHQDDINGAIDIYTYITVPNDCPTIENGLSKALSGQIVSVPPGTYYPSLYPSSSLVVPSGVTLEIKGTAFNRAIVAFGGGDGIVSYGKMDCNYTTFTGLNWNGISLQGSGSNNSKFNYCNINQVFNYGGSTLSFTNSSGSEVSYCSISNPTGVSTNGILASNASLSIAKNKIQNCPGAGVVAGSNSSISFGISTVYPSFSSGNNFITGNNKGVNIYSSSFMSLGGSSSKYYNSISGSSSGIIGSIYSYSGLEYTETYLDQPSTFDKDASSSISAGSLLSAPPAPPFKIGVIEEDNSIVITPTFKKAISNTVSSDMNELLRQARELQYNDNYNEAFDIYKSILSFTNDDFYLAQSLTGIRFVYGATQNEEILNYVKEYNKGEKPPYVNIAYANMLVINNKFDEAMLEYEKVSNNYPNTYYEVVSLVSQVQLYYFWKHDEGRALEILSYLEKIAPDDIGFQNIRSILLRESGNSKENFDNEEIKETKETTVTETKLFANYPNPFNPTTVIKYQIPEAAEVSLKVYDVIGKEVATLVNSYQARGSYDVTFNANGLSSGIYFYKLNANGKQFINKMLLMK